MVFCGARLITSHGYLVSIVANGGTDGTRLSEIIEMIHEELRDFGNIKLPSVRFLRKGANACAHSLPRPVGFYQLCYIRQV
jgi:hypothetical protein